MDLQDGGHCSHLGFAIGRILAIFDLQIALTRPAKFLLKWPFRSGEVQNRCSRWRLWQPPWFSDRNNYRSEGF